MPRGLPRVRRRAAHAVLACLAIVLAPPALAEAADRVSPASTATPGEADRIAAYWTPQRMRSTPPLAAPGRRRDPLARISFTPVAEPTAAPYAVNGRLFLRQGKQTGFCSATAIDSPSRRLVLTAAHCLNSGPVGPRRGSVWSSKVEFVPAYSGGIAPFGSFVAGRNAVFVSPKWRKTGNPNFDVGAIAVRPNAEGVEVADAVGGGATLALDRSRRQRFETFGYPGGSRTLQVCRSPYVGDDVLTYRIPGPPTMAIRCRWTPGASGGGWLVEAGTTINGLTSYGKRKDKTHTFSPYFSDANVGRLIVGL